MCGWCSCCIIESEFSLSYFIRVEMFMQLF